MAQVLTAPMLLARSTTLAARSGPYHGASERVCSIRLFDRSSSVMRLGYIVHSIATFRRIGRLLVSHRRSSNEVGHPPGRAKNNRKQYQPPRQSASSHVYRDRQIDENQTGDKVHHRNRTEFECHRRSFRICVIVIPAVRPPSSAERFADNQRAAPCHSIATSMRVCVDPLVRPTYSGYPPGCYSACRHS